jgi:uncharacterized LabA/DUF88 family protein
MKRVAVFIDHSNVYHNLRDVDWPVRVKTYDPLFVAKRMAGGRQLAKTMFYCSAPPPALQETNLESYELQERYLSEVAKLKNVEVRFANLILQSDGKYHEKNLDTQMTTDMLMMAFRNEYDIAVILSNDGDFADAVKSVRELGKKTEVGYFKGSLSFNLRQAADLIRRMRPSYFKDLLQEKPTLFDAEKRK